MGWLDCEPLRRLDYPEWDARGRNSFNSYIVKSCYVADHIMFCALCLLLK